jgi:hypothetical protein
VRGENIRGECNEGEEYKEVFKEERGAREREISGTEKVVRIVTGESERTTIQVG